MNEEELKQAMKELIFLPKDELIKALLNKQQEVLQLKEQLKQRDEVIDEAIEFIDSDIHFGWIKVDDFLLRILEIKEILKKYKGDNK